MTPLASLTRTINTSLPAFAQFVLTNIMICVVKACRMFMRLHMLARANCWQVMVYDMVDLQADSIMHAKTPMCQLVQAVCKGLFRLPTRACPYCLQELIQGSGQIARKGFVKLPARVCSNCLQGFRSICLQGFVQTACKDFVKLPARVWSNCLQGLGHIACKGLVKLPARACSSLQGFLQTNCKCLSAITFFTPAASCADMLLWPL